MTEVPSCFMIGTFGRRELTLVDGHSSRNPGFNAVRRPTVVGKPTDDMMKRGAQVVLWRNAFLDEFDEIARQEGIASIPSVSISGLGLECELVVSVFAAVKFCNNGVDHVADVGYVGACLWQRIAGNDDVPLGVAIAFNLHRRAGQLLLSVHLGASTVSDDP
jgi:hypothetical protein